jgi:hypothetical protein
MGAPATWRADQFGCLTRDSVSVLSLLRTQMTESLPVPMVSRKGDTSAPLELQFAIEVTEAGYRAWEQWWTYDLHDGALPFLIFIPWGTEQPRVRARIMGAWSATRLDSFRWRVNATMQIDRDSLPRFSGGADA